jgi:GDP-4-dehydro-6-deoxy-D-mannose reductase
MSKIIKKVLITGITGFAGSHLAELLVSEKKYDVFGTSLSDKHLDNLALVKDSIKLYQVDLKDADKTQEVIKDCCPDIIFHLAALTSVAKSFNNPAQVIANNSTAQINVLEAVRLLNKPLDKILIISSAEVYGFVSERYLPIDESVPFNPDNPYSVSKINQDYLGLSYFLAYKLPIVVLRPFNHIGPRLSSNISISRFAKAIAEIEKSKNEPVITVGNLAAKRDFTDVSDMVYAYALAAQYCENGQAYNVGSGVSHTIKEMLNKLLALSSVKIRVEIDQSLFRPSDIPELRCNPLKFQKISGWKPQIPIERTLQDTLDYWRENV